MVPGVPSHQTLKRAGSRVSFGGFFISFDFSRTHHGPLIKQFYLIARIRRRIFSLTHSRTGHRRRTIIFILTSRHIRPIVGLP